jgi:hypothetical protein
VLIGIFLLSLSVACEACDSTPDSSANAISNSTAEIAQLALSFLSLTRCVLLAPLALEVLAADQVSNCFFPTTDGLIPSTLTSVGGLFGRYARRAKRIRTSLNSGVGGVRLGSSFGLALVGVSLVSGATSNSSDSRLDGTYMTAMSADDGNWSAVVPTGCRVDVGLESRSVLVRHFV